MFFFSRRPLAALIVVLALGAAALFGLNIGAGKAAMGTTLDDAKVGTCVKGETQEDTRVVPCGDPAATAKIVKIFPKIELSDVMTAAACGAVDEADGAFYTIDPSIHGDRDTTAYCIVSV
jgi:hypothetical protein